VHEYGIGTFALGINAYYCAATKKSKMNKHSGLLLALVFSYVAGFAQSKSLLWEISGNGLSKPSYLYGTMHVSDRIAFNLTDSFFIALKSADVIALESNPETWIENDFGRPDKSNNYNYEDSYRNDYNGYFGDFYTAATSVTVPNTFQLGGLFADNSGLINGYLYRYDARRTDYEEETYLDLFIFQCGKKLSKEIAALEGEQEVLKLLQKAYEPSEDEDEESKYIEKQKMEDAFEDEDGSIYEQIDQAYRDGDLDKLDSLELLTMPSSQYRKYFIEERNVNMVRRMDSILRSGKVVFTGIGAAHLPGERGALDLLREMGYTVKPVKGKTTGKSTKEKNKIDAIYYSRQLQLQYPTDSSFKVMCPGKLYNLGGANTNEFYLYPDMANSAYYSVMRIAHYGKLNQDTPQDILNDIDKILFENVPGDIQSKTNIKSVNGDPGFDIISKTKRGNYLRIKIFITPLEIIVFKASGINDFVIKSKEMQSFFSSIEFVPVSNKKWTSYSPDWGLFKISVPENYLRYAVDTGSTFYTINYACQLSATDDNYFYYFSSYYLNDINSIEEDSFELTVLNKRFAEQFKKDDYELKATTFNTVENYPSCESVYHAFGKYLHVKSVIRGPYYYVMATFSDLAAKPDAFFSSFEFSDILYHKPFTIYADTALGYTVNTIAPFTDTLLTISELQLYYYNDDFGGFGNDDDEIDDAYKGESRYMTFYNESGPESILVDYKRVHKFFSFESAASFWTEFTKRSEEKMAYQLTRVQLAQTDSLHTFSYLETDTNSTRGIYRKIIIKGDVMYRLSTVVDTTANYTTFVHNFYDSFLPNDTIGGADIFTSKNKLFLDQLYSSDSILKKQALASMYQITFTENDIPMWLEYLNSPAFNSLAFDDRLDLLNYVDFPKDNNLVPFFKQLYMNAGDTAVLQISALANLATIQTELSTKTLLSLLYIETPLTNNEYKISDIFYDYTDSIELASMLFPGLMDFVNLPEYKPIAYTLMAAIATSDKNKSNIHQQYKKQIFTEAQAELKRNVGPTAKYNNRYEYDPYYDNEYYFSSLSSIAGSGDAYNFDIWYDDYTLTNWNESEDEDTPDTIAYEPFSYATGSLQDNYALLMTRFYEDSITKKYFEKIYKSKDDDLIFRTATIMADAKLPVSDTVWNYFLKNPVTRLKTFSYLNVSDQLSKIDTAIINQQMMAEACLYQYEIEPGEDTIQFLSKRLVDGPLGEGYVYFYKSKFSQNNDKTWHLDCIGVMPVDSTKLSMDVDFVFYGDAILDEEQLEKQITQILDAIQLVGRKRIQAELPSEEYNYDYYDY
jgi:uncharacterized protein YbaP (TraB family)